MEWYVAFNKSYEKSRYVKSVSKLEVESYRFDVKTLIFVQKQLNLESCSNFFGVTALSLAAERIKPQQFG